MTGRGHIGEDGAMKRAHAILIGVLAVGCTSKGPDIIVLDESASGDDSTTGGIACEQLGWESSVAAYEALAEQAGNTYWYSMMTYEYIDDYQWSCSYRTTLEFIADVPARRTFELVGVADGTMVEQCTGMPFVEEDDAVGATGGTYAFPVSTMQQLYSSCCDLLSIEPQDAYWFYFEVDDDDVVDSCYALDKDCVEGPGCTASVDGFAGFDFEAFGFGSPP
jgi:hypothetical protein